MESVLHSITPRDVFGYFGEICAIPHGSYNEGAIADYLCAFAKEKGLLYRRDDMNNVLIRKSASKGYENEPAVMLQGHTDMVCVKRADKVHDFKKDPLQLVVNGDWLSADGTTLGADDGIAVAMMLAILANESLCHPELECLFTVQEEVGLGGASGFDYSDIRAKLLYNLDSEDEGVGTVSCAGGLRIDLYRETKTERMDSAYAVLHISGLKGGHSGAEIHLPRGNAHKIAGMILASLAEKAAFRLVSIEGGEMDNAIPANCTAVIAYADTEEAVLREMLDRLCAEQTAILSHDDSEKGSIFAEYGRGTVRVMREQDTECVLGILNLSPNGVATMCEDMPGLVESSCNMGVLHTDDNGVSFGFLARASVEARKEELRIRLAQCALAFGASIAYSGAYPGWEYDKHSVAAKRYVNAYEKLWGTKPRVEAIHAGLECGIIKHAVAGLDPISIGPDMKDIHTPDERISISSVERVYKTVLAMLAEKSAAE